MYRKGMGRGKKIILTIIILIIIIAFVALPAYIAYASVHLKHCKLSNTPADYNLRYESVSVKTADGLTLRGWVVYPSGPEKPIVFVVMHGYTSCKGADYIMAVTVELAKRGYTVVAFDFRDHGESDGDTTSIGPIESKYDAPAIINFTAQKFPGKSIVLLGYSMGGVVAIMSGNHNPHVSAIIADSPYPELGMVVPRWLKSKMGVPVWYSKIIGFYGKMMTGVNMSFGPMSVKKIDKPLLVIAGTEDPLITPDEAKEIANKSVYGQPLIVKDAGHVESIEVLGPKKYVDAIELFLYGINLESSAPQQATPTI